MSHGWNRVQAFGWQRRRTQRSFKNAACAGGGRACTPCQPPTHVWNASMWPSVSQPCWIEQHASGRLIGAAPFAAPPSSRSAAAGQEAGSGSSSSGTNPFVSLSPLDSRNKCSRSAKDRQWWQLPSTSHGSRGDLNEVSNLQWRWRHHGDQLQSPAWHSV